MEEEEEVERGGGGKVAETEEEEEGDDVSYSSSMNKAKVTVISKTNEIAKVLENQQKVQKDLKDKIDAVQKVKETQMKVLAEKHSSHQSDKLMSVLQCLLIFATQLT